MVSEDFYGIQQHEIDAVELEVNTILSPTAGLDITTGAFMRQVLDTYNNYDLPSMGTRGWPPAPRMSRS